MKVRSRGSRWRIDFPAAVIFCTVFFLAGFYTSSILSSFKDNESTSIPRSNKIEAHQNHEESLEIREPQPHGVSGEANFNSIPFQILSWNPRAVYYPRFASEEQCNEIINKAKSRLSPSGLSLRKGETEDSTKNIRTSSGTFLASRSDRTGALAFVEDKIAKATMIPSSHGEPFNVLRYEIGQKYDSHYDSFNPTEYGPQRSQRVASFLLYLSDVEEGGETMFPYENGENVGNYDYRKCVGLKIKPKQGDGLLFYSLMPNSTIDKTSLHGSCPVIKGQKWVATKWIRNKEL